MRLVCPNCDAKYEVPDDAIPQSGRDVQCANCNHAWFQMRPGTEPVSLRKPAVTMPSAVPDPVPEAAPTAEPEPAVADASEVAAEPDVEPVVESAAAADVAKPASEPEVPHVSEPAVEAHAETAAPPAPPAAAAKGYAVDESVLAILREEAEREARARSVETRPAEPQPDAVVEHVMPAAAALGAGAAVTAVASARASDAAERDVIDDPIEDGLRPSARRDLLPDVEEINSTLRPSERPADPDADIDALPDLTAGRNSFRSGFLLMMALAIVGLATYLAAPRLSEQVPSLEGPLTAYVGFVDQMRLQLDGLMQTATTALNGS